MSFVYLTSNIKFITKSINLKLRKFPLQTATGRNADVSQLEYVKFSCNKGLFTMMLLVRKINYLIFKCGSLYYVKYVDFHTM